ncbi:MAG: hypothetical protein U9O98_06765 [Asgard group archaeon]|nr:hypothetical protein [Asgard group archaeon]
MSHRQRRYCKFCGEPVIYLEEYDDYYCERCHSYQTQSHSVDIKGKKTPPMEMDTSLPPTNPPKLPPKWEDNIPIFRHREYLVIQAFFSFGPRYSIYNVSGQKMGECQGKILSFGGEFDFFDSNRHHVAKVKGNLTLLPFQDKVWNITDHQGHLKGKIKSRFGFLKRTWELYDDHNRLIGQPDEQVWIKLNWRMLHPNGRVALSVDKKWLTFRDQFRVRVSQNIDPLLALAFAIAVDYMYFQDND